MVTFISIVSILQLLLGWKPDPFGDEYCGGGRENPALRAAESRLTDGETDVQSHGKPERLLT